MVVCLRRVLFETKKSQKSTIIYQNNKGAIEWAQGGPAWQFACRKHMDIRQNFIVSMVERECVEMFQIPSEEMVADLFAKIMGP